MHPDPDVVNKKLEDFFSMESCLNCHEEIETELVEGVHASEKIQAETDYTACLQCHDPHYQMSSESKSSTPIDYTKPIRNQCNTCHELQPRLPDFSSEDEACMICHRNFDADTVERKAQVESLCFHCHGNQRNKTQVLGHLAPLLDEAGFPATTHAAMDCLSCHPESANFEHGSQPVEDCRQCHTPHDEKKAHDAHTRIACQACHLNGILPVRVLESNAILWKRLPAAGQVSDLHHMDGSNDEAFCGKCHFEGNDLGAATMILPAKSVLCMPCHAATLSVGDLTSVLGIVVFLFGIGMAVSVWVSGASASKAVAPVPGSRIVSHSHVDFHPSHRAWFLTKTAFLDIFLQRRLYQRSAKRWLIHSLLFFPLVFRGLWGVTALFTSIWLPQRSFPWSVLLNKNHPATAFLFDLTGVMIALGVIMALFRGRAQEQQSPPDIPGQDRWALGLLGSIVFVGFFLEGIRMAMAGVETAPWHAAIGFSLSQLFSQMTGLAEIYGYVWYLHAILTGALVAYLPFSRLMHTIMAPVVLWMRLFSGHEGKKNLNVPPHEH